MTRRCIALRHIGFEDLGTFEPVIRAAGYSVHYLEAGTDPMSAEQLADVDLLVVLGGPVGANDEDRYPFLTVELELLRTRMRAQAPTLGICLGAQLMARVLGARVHRGPMKEIGFAPVQLTDSGRRSCLAPLEAGPVLHWHADTFELPAGTTRLAMTPAYENQAFAVGANLLAVQFHPEAGGPGFERWLIGHAIELDQAGLDVAALRADHARLSPGLVRRGQACISAWLQQIRV